MFNNVFFRFFTFSSDRVSACCIHIGKFWESASMTLIDPPERKLAKPTPVRSDEHGQVKRVGHLHTLNDSDNQVIKLE